MTKAILVLSSTLALLAAACSQTTPAPTTYERSTPSLSVVGDVSPSPAGEGYIQSSSSVHHSAFIFEVQHRLKALGYYEGEVDGANGPKTKAAVAHFQHDNNLKVTGVVDQHTDTALKLSSGK
jgi:peptidoglycan hydrolase-like protein with peptidoglycan-binding domain